MSCHVNRSSVSTRREFLKTSGATAGVAAVGLSIARGAHAAGNDVIKIGLIGCGGRGSGAASQALSAGKDIRLVAMADLRESKANGSRKRIAKAHGQRVDVPDERLFAGFDAYKKVLASDIDAVLIATTSHFHPDIFAAAIEAGKHVFCEKPHGLDPAGVKQFGESCKLAEKKGLSVVSGLMNRYRADLRATVEKINDGAIGDIIAIQHNYVCGPYHANERPEGMSEMEYQYHNWYHFNWLAGDQVMQQLIHSIDKGNFVLGDLSPTKAWGQGGRSACFGEKYGDLFDHQTVIYDFPNGTRMYGICHNLIGAAHPGGDWFYGTKGKAGIGYINGETNWKYSGSNANPYQVEHNELFQSIRDGKPINNGKYMVNSTLMAIMGQLCCLTGQELTWDQMLNSKYSVAQKAYGYDQEPPIKPNKDGGYDLAIPGMTKFS